jgi:AcrR family transcriptional regulator
LVGRRDKVGGTITAIRVDGRSGMGTLADFEAGSASLHKPTVRKLRGRPRPPATDQSILKATMELLTEGGSATATIDAIALRSGRAKTTIYRRWPSREALILDALRLAVRGTTEQVEARRDLDVALGSSVRGAARNILVLVQNPVFRAAFPTISHELLGETTLGNRFRAEVFRPIRASLKTRLRDEVARGEIRPDIDFDLVFDMVNGAMLYRALVGEPIGEGIAEAIADLILSGAAVEANASRPNTAVNPRRPV